MTVIVDSRERREAVAPILAWFDHQGIAWTRRKLDVGDYQIEGRPELVVDRKQSLGEMAINLLSHDRARFYREVRRAREKGVKLMILCEQGHEVKTVEDVRKWHSPYTQISGARLADAIFRLEIGYGVETYFCDRASTGKRIIELLRGDGH